MRGLTVLNLFSYTCAFGVVAMASGAKRALNAPNLRDLELLQWVADFMTEMLDAPKISVAGAAADSAAADKAPKKKVFSVSE